MTDFTRRDVVNLMTALMITGASIKPNRGYADGRSALIIQLMILTILIVIIYVVLGNIAFRGDMKTAKAVKDSARSGQPSAAQRLRSARKCGSIKQKGDTLHVALSSKCAAEVANKRSLKLSIPVPAQGMRVDLKLRRQNERGTQTAIAASKSGGKTVGTVRMDAYGMLFDIKQAKLR